MTEESCSIDAARSPSLGTPCALRQLWAPGPAMLSGRQVVMQALSVQGNPPKSTPKGHKRKCKAKPAIMCRGMWCNRRSIIVVPGPLVPLREQSIRAYPARLDLRGNPGIIVQASDLTSNAVFVTACTTLFVVAVLDPAAFATPIAWQSNTRREPAAALRHRQSEEEKLCNIALASF